MAQAGQGQQQAQNGGATEAQMGQEFQPGQQSAGQQGQQGQSGQSGSSSRAGSGGSGTNPGRGNGGFVGPQDPLPGPKTDKLFPGTEIRDGRRLTATYMDQPDRIQSKTGRYNMSSDQRRAVEGVMERDNIPIDRQQQVRKYIDSLGR